MILTSSTTSHAFLQATEILMSQPVVPPSGSFVVILFFIVGCQERDCGQVFILCSNASNDTKSMNLTVYTRAAALLYCNLDVSVILWGKTKFELTQRGENIHYKLLSVTRGLKLTHLCTVTKEKHSGVCGIDVNRLQLNQVVQRASACVLRGKKRSNSRTFQGPKTA